MGCAITAKGNSGMPETLDIARAVWTNPSVIIDVAAVPAFSTVTASCKLHDEQLPQSPTPEMTASHRLTAGRHDQQVTRFLESGELLQGSTAPINDVLLADFCPVGANNARRTEYVFPNVTFLPAGGDQQISKLFWYNENVVSSPDRVRQHVVTHLPSERLQDFYRISGPLVHYLPRRTRRHDSHGRLSLGDFSFLRQRSPRAVFFILGNREGKFSGMPKGGAVQFTRDHTEYIDQDQADRSADRRIRTVAVTEDVVRSVHADERSDRTVDNNERRCPAGACRGPMEFVLGVAHGTEDCNNNRHVGRQAARKHRVDGCLFCDNRPLADLFDTDDVAGRKTGRIQTFTDALFGGRNNRKPVSPSLRMIKLVYRESIGQIVPFRPERLRHQLCTAR